jgi:O-acetyl-ADP-ribose deacetylase (regulator of RNase III)
MHNERTHINYILGDATQPVGDGPRIIAHVCNDIGGWGRGFVVAISKRWKSPEAEYRAWSCGERDISFKLGEVQFVSVEKALWVANMVGQHKTSPVDGVPPVRYDAIEAGLAKVTDFAIDRNASIHMPRIGCGLAGGSWEIVENLIELSVCHRGVPVTVYDLPPE